VDKPPEGTWEEFEAWIRDTLGSDFVWKIRPADTRSSREMIATLIKNSMAHNNGVFPRNDAFIERVEA